MWFLIVNLLNATGVPKSSSSLFVKTYDQSFVIPLLISQCLKKLYESAKTYL